MDKQKAIDDLKMLEGLPPYDGGSNHCRGDGYFARSLEQKYGMSLEALQKEVGFDKIRQEWQNQRQKFLNKY